MALGFAVLLALYVGIYWWLLRTQDNRFWIFSRTPNVHKNSYLFATTPNGACFLVITHSWSLPHGSFFASLQNKSDWCSKPMQCPVVSCAQPGYPVHTCPMSAYLVWRNSRRHHHRSFGWWWSLISENMASTYFAPFLVLLHRFWDQRAQNAVSPKNKNFYY